MPVGRLDETSPLMRKKEPPIEYAAQVFRGFLPFAMIVIGVVGLMHFEGWPILTSLYVIVQIVTTIGYGDFTVETQAAKIFLSCYTVACLVVLAFYMSNFVEYVLNLETQFVRSHMRRMQASFGEDTKSDDVKDRNKLIAMGAVFLTFLGGGVVFFHTYEDCTCSYGIGAIKDCLETDFATCSATGGRVKGWVDVLYMSVITLTTVGFGDYQPRSLGGRIFGIVWMVLGVGATASFVSMLTSKFLEVKKKKHYNNVDISEINQDVFNRIDRDKNGYLSRGEFVNYTLVKYGLVPEDLLDEINCQYDKLDTKRNNMVSFAMIVDRQNSDARRRVQGQGP